MTWNWRKFPSASIQSLERTKQEVIPSFLQFLGPVLSCCSDLHKIYFDDESYNRGHGRAYDFLGINPREGALIIVRPDQCEWMSLSGVRDGLLTRSCRCLSCDESQ